MLECPACHIDYAYGRVDASNEGRDPLRGGYRPTAAQCPNCGYGYSDDDPAVPARGGDRVLVLKYLYEFGEPQPWDVVVFKNPQTNRENYIKRLIGLPGETIEIVGGDIFVTPPGQDRPRIRRKPLATQEAVWQVLYDNDYPPDPNHFSTSWGTEPPWPGWQPGRRGAAWETASQGGRRLDFLGSDQPSRLEYRPGQKGFVTHSGYNAPNAGSVGADALRICTDWKLRAVLTAADQAEGTLAIVFEGYDDRFRAEFKTGGTVRLLHQPRGASAEDWAVWGQADVGAFTPGQGRIVSLAVADFRASIQVDDEEVLASSDAQYAGSYEQALRRTMLEQKVNEARTTAEQLESRVARLERTSQPSETQQDELPRLREELADAQAQQKSVEQMLLWAQQPSIYLEAQGAALSLTHVRLMRDLYYTSRYLKIPDTGPEFAYVNDMLRSTGAPAGPNSWRQEGGQYLGWGVQGNPIHLRDMDDDNLDEFFCLGDNSPQSHDGRSWVAAAPSLRLFGDNGEMLYQLGTVPRYNMLGRAMLVYWPAGYPLPIVGLPLVPNVGEMRMIR